MSKSNINIKFKAQGANQMVTGSAHRLEIKVNSKTTNILLDLGAIQDGKLDIKDSFKANRLDIDMSDIECVIVSHAHLDHCMNLCQLSRLDFNGNIYMTDLTLQLAEHITLDGINIHEKTVVYLNKAKSKKEPEVLPYMNIKSRQMFLDNVKAYGFDNWIKINDNIRFKFINAGHISGASMIYIEVTDGCEVETILYTGDTSCNRSIPFTKIPNIEGLKIDNLITESTYGGQNIPQKLEDEMVEELYNIIYNTCIKNKGTTIIPSFALARSTNLAYYVKKTYEKYPNINNIPIYMMSPLMEKCHKTISKNADYYDNKWKKEMDLFSWNKISFISNYKDVLAIGSSKKPCVIISSAGMDIRGVNSYLIPRKSESDKNTIVFVGYCAENTVGYQLINGLIDELSYNIDGNITKVDVKINVKNISGLSSHACGYEIIDMIKTANTNKLKTVIIVHGDLNRGKLLKKDFEKSFNNINVYIPKINQKIKLK